MPDTAPELRRFVALFNAGRFWDSHEALETPWRRVRSGFYHGLILYASAFVHVQRRNRHGVRAQLRKAERALLPYRPAYLGLDVDAILGHARRCLELVDRAGTPLAEHSIPMPRLELHTDLVRGDEAELRG